MTVAELAREWDCTRANIINNYIKTGKIKAELKKIGNIQYYEIDEKSVKGVK